jgi:hypothetical protein
VKIIARGESGQLFAELSEDEFAQLQGYPNSYHYTQARRRDPRVGDEIDLGAWFDSCRIVVAHRQRIQKLRDEFADQVTRLDKALAAVGDPEIES